MEGSTAAAIASVIIISGLVVGATLYLVTQQQVEQRQLGDQIGSLESQIQSLANKPATTVTNTIVSAITSVLTTTQVVTTTSTFRVSVYPTPSNVTVLFTQVSGEYSYSISAGTSTFTGSSSFQQSVPLTSVFQGEVISISASESGAGGCAIGATVTVRLFVDGQIVAQSTTQCTGSNAQITYTI